MRSNIFTVSEIPTMTFSIQHTSIDAASPLNQNESHIHKECEIYINLSGDVSFEVENRMYPVSKGSVIITRPYEYHHCIYHSDRLHEHYWITFSMEENEDLLKMFFHREKGTDNLIVLENEELTLLCKVLDELLEKNISSLKRRINILQIFYILGMGKQADYIYDTSHLPKDVALALRHMEDHLTEDISIQALAHLCNVSVNTLERHFKEQLKVSPLSVLRKKRLTTSMQYLRNGSTVSEAAVKSGFSDYSNYIQLFKKQFGMTPLQYRKNLDL